MNPVAEALRRMPLLDELPEASVERLAEHSCIVEFPPGSVIFRQGEPASTMHLVLEGEVALEICAPGIGCRRILTVSPGELLGWSPALGESQLTATARALTSTRTVAVNGERIRDACETDPRFGYEFMKRVAVALARRLNATRLQLLNVYGGQMPPVTDDRFSMATLPTDPQIDP